MEGSWPAILINSAVVIFLWGLVWRLNSARLEKLERTSGLMVDREYCRLQHGELREDLNELKAGQKELLEAMRAVEKKLARLNGEKSVARRKEDEG